MEEVQERVIEALKSAGQPLRPGDVAKATGLEKEVVSKAIAALKKQGKVVSPKNCYYSPAK